MMCVGGGVVGKLLRTKTPSPSPPEKHFLEKKKNEKKLYGLFFSFLFRVSNIYLYSLSSKMCVVDKMHYYYY